MEGTALGPYRLLKQLGSGGMGKVYRAEVTGSAPGLERGRAVALKVIHAHLLETPGFFKRFLREADIGRAIEHENVVRTYDCDARILGGVQQNFLVMEYVEGQTLRDLLKELGQVPEELCRHIGREVSKGLAAIHEAGVVHRDLKPENVLISPEQVVKVMDLGVARLQAEAIRLSRAGTFVGSLEYAAPEQFRPSDVEPDGRADLHALGVLLYELSTGRHPYRDEDASKVLRRILDEEPRKAGEVNPQLSPFFEEVVQTLLAKDRDRRFPTAGSLAGILAAGESSVWWKERARALRVATRRPLRRIRIPRETALYGRDEELAWMRKAFDAARSGDGQVLLMEGEAGIGKTRLVDEFVGRLRRDGEDLNFLFGSYPPGGAATAAGAFSTAYREHFGTEGLEDALQAYLTVTPLLLPAFAALLRGDATPTGGEPLTKDSLQTVFVRATRGLAAERPTIVLIDDLHFAPEAGLALFASLALAVPGHRVLLVGTMRPGVPEDWIADVERQDQASRRVLGRLGPKDLALLLRDAFHSDRLANELGTKIGLKCDGNPFFTFEIIRGLREGQVITQQPDGAWATSGAIQDIEVPSSVIDLVNARVADLEDVERNLLDAASCCGFQFDPVLVGVAVGLARVPTLQAFGRIEKRHRLVRSAGRSYVFDHHQVQEALYGALNEQLREAYHAAIAEAAEAHVGARDKEPRALDGALCVSLCENFLSGARGERAARYLEAALDHLEGGYLNDRAIALARRLLQVPGLMQGEERVNVLLRVKNVLQHLGRRREEDEVLEEVVALTSGSEDRALRARVENAIGTSLLRRSRLDEAREHLERSLALHREIGDRRGECRNLSNLGALHTDLGHFEEARIQLERGLAIARQTGDRSTEASKACNLGIVFLRSGRYVEARAQFEQHLAIARELGDRRSEARAIGNLGSIHATLGHGQEARAHAEQYLAIAREVGDRRGEATAAGTLGVISQGRGHLREARVYFEQHLAISREIGYQEGEAVALVNLGPLWLALGQAQRARTRLEESLGICRRTGARFPEGYALAGLCAVAYREGAIAEALDFGTTALELRRRIRHGDGVADSLVQLAEIHHQAGDHAAARDALTEAVGLLREQDRKGYLVKALSVLACLPGGDSEAAVAACRDAGESADTLEVHYYLWRATGSSVHLHESKRVLDHLVEHAPAELRESMLANVPTNRMIMEAWARPDREPLGQAHGEPGRVE